MKKVKWRYSDCLAPHMGQVAKNNGITEEEAYARVCLIDETIPLVYDEFSHKLTNEALDLYYAEKYSVVEMRDGFQIVREKDFTAVGAEKLYKNLVRVHTHGDKMSCEKYIENWEKTGIFREILI